MSVIPHYFLYGESNRDVDQRFLHIETLSSRSRQHHWSIQPHAHEELHHLLLIAQGTGQFDIDTRSSSIVVPQIISVPARCVHGFRFEPDSDGWIITSSSALLRRISQVHPEFEALLNRPANLMLSTDEAAHCADKFARLACELRDTQTGYRAAAESALLAILVDVIRLQSNSGSTVVTHHDADADLVVRYKNLIERHFHSRVGARDYAVRLCVCHERLRSACVRITGVSPLALLNARRLLEAKRHLLYSNMSIAEVAYQSGFEDPAYFSRFFARSAGKSPREYRLTHAR